MAKDSVFRVNLKHLKFKVWAKRAINNEPMFSGFHKDVLTFLTNNNNGNLEVSALCTHTGKSLAPMSVFRWIAWYYYMVIPELSKNGRIDDIQIDYPISPEYIDISEMKNGDSSPGLDLDSAGRGVSDGGG